MKRQKEGEIGSMKGKETKKEKGNERTTGSGVKGLREGVTYEINRTRKERERRDR